MPSRKKLSSRAHVRVRSSRLTAFRAAYVAISRTSLEAPAFFGDGNLAL